MARSVSRLGRRALVPITSLVFCWLALVGPASAAEAVTFNSAGAPPTPFAVRKAKERGVELKAKPGILLRGLLSRPQGAGRHPAVVLLPPCSGVDSNNKAWAEALAQWGYVALLVDSFGPRGVREICSPIKFDFAGVAFDLYGALAYLRSQSFVDPDRVGAMGWDSGARRVLSGNQTVGVKSLFKEKFRAAVVLYPNCQGLSGPFAVPLLVLAAEKDDWSPVAQCQAMAKRGGPKGHPVSVVVYPGAHHGFDNSAYPAQKYLPDVENRNKSPARGATVGYDRTAHQDALKRVRSFLDKHLK